jgi:hypothetical protein
MAINFKLFIGYPLCGANLIVSIAKKELASKNQNPRSELRREALQLTSWVLCPK